MAISGQRDLRPIAERAIDLLPNGTLAPLPGIGHSALDTHPLAALFITNLTAHGLQHQLPRLAQHISQLPRTRGPGLLGPLINTRLTLEKHLPRPGVREKS